MSLGKIFSFTFFIIIVLLLANLHMRGILLHDEGLILNAAARVYSGEIPYKDFQFIYTPFSPFLLAIFFHIFGESIFTERLLAFFISLGNVLLIYKIAKNISGRKIIGYLSVIFFILWGPGVINFVWPVMLCIFLGLLSSYLLFKFSENGKLFLAILIGGLSALLLLTKQNFGIAILVTHFFMIFLISSLRQKDFLIRYVFGWAVVILLFVSYLVFNNALGIFIYDMYDLLVVKVLTQGMLTSPFIYEAPLWKQIPHTIFYLLPAFICAAAFIVSRKRKALLVFILLPFFYYLLSIRPTTDFVHLAPLISISVLPIVIIAGKKKFYIPAVLTISIFILLGTYVWFFRGYYRWEAPAPNHTLFYSDKKVNIFMDAKNYNVLETFAPELEKSPSEFIFVYHYAPAFYFISSKKNPTRYDYLPPAIFTKEVQSETISLLKEKSVDTIITDKPLDEATLFEEFLTNNYYPARLLGELTLWKKSPE